MKARYVIPLILLLGVAALFVQEVFSATCVHPNLDKVLQGVGVFVALIASVIALSAADPKRKQIKVKCAVDIEKSAARYDKNNLSHDLQTRFGNHSDPVEARQVTFRLTNCTGVTLKKPMLAFRLPMDRQHPTGAPNSILSQVNFNSNLYNSTKDLQRLEMGDSMILANNNLPNWNPGEDIAIWIRMIVTDPKDAPFEVKVDINCENAEGVTLKEKIQSRPALHSNASSIPPPAPQNLQS